MSGTGRARTCLPAECLELRVGEDVGDVDEFQLGPQVRLVVAVLQHRLAERDARERRGDVAAVAELLEELGHQRLDRPEDVLLLDERHLDIELVELAGRTVGAGVLVAEARRDLEVAVEAGDHQQLLELLRSLGQGVELARVQAGRDDEVTGALGRRRGEDRGRHLVEAEGHHLGADGADDGRAQHDVAVHALAAQVEEAVLQAPLLVDPVLGVDREGQRGGLAQHLDLGDLDLDLAGRELRVDVVGAARGDLAVDPYDGLLGELRQGLVAGGAGTGDELHQTVVVAQIDEEDAAQVSAIVQPAAQPDVGADVRGAELAAGVGPVPMHSRSSSLRGSGWIQPHQATARTRIESLTLTFQDHPDGTGGLRPVTGRAVGDHPHWHLWSRSS